jgi:glycosyltransferase involved in cell wall biosynthesis
VRLYGEFQQDTSRASVARGFQSVFRGAHCVELSEWGNDLDDVRGFVPGASDKDGVFLGSLDRLSVAMRVQHQHLWVMVAPNSNTVGGHVSAWVSPEAVSLLAPSAWGAEVLRELFPKKRVLTVPHGVSDNFRPPPSELTFGSRQFRVLHMSSSVLQRKGTYELLQAWRKVCRHDWVLFLSVPTEKQRYFQQLLDALKMPPGSVHVAGRLGYFEARMAELYWQMDAVCQPSRGEGFGMVPLEARACGTPAIMTTCTGHSEHAQGPGVVPIATGELEEIDDFPGALAPSLRAEDVAAALEDAYLRRDSLKAETLAAAADIREHWSWENQLAAFHAYITKGEK